MEVLIIGDQGSMGRRYEAILNYLDIPSRGYDNFVANKSNGKDIAYRATVPRGFLGGHEGVTHIIIATPTDNHYWWLKELSQANRKIRILCEKPITKDLNEMLEIAGMGLDLTMMYQYKEMGTVCTSNNPRTSYYNFYNHGKDGLAWDCIQLIGMAERDILLEEDSPVWHVKTNGNTIESATVNESYMHFVESWLNGEEKQDIDELLDLHIKTAKLQNKVKFDGKHHSLDWNSSSHKQHKTT